MGWFKEFFSSSIGRKFIMAITGLFFVLFIIEHMVGNLLLILPDDGETYNVYSHFMVNFWPIKIVEVVLFASIIFHVIYALVITIRNRQSRPVGYKMNSAHDNSSWVSRNMGFLGVILFIFLVIHLSGFFASARITHDVPSVTIDGTEMHDMYTLVKAKFEIWWFDVIYLLGFAALAGHLWHGFQSGFRTLGLRHPKYIPLFKGLGFFIAIVIPLGFAIVPLYFLINSLL
jgi:succinate dehydrogenase / fumarate reductase cytochrome b subunit